MSIEKVLNNICILQIYHVQTCINYETISTTFNPTFQTYVYCRVSKVGE